MCIRDSSRGCVLEFQHPTEGHVKQPAFPAKVSNMRPGLHTLPPRFGEHTKEVLHSLGYSEEEIKELQEKKVI